MSLRIGFDVDGVLADFSSRFREVEGRLFGTPPRSDADQPELQDGRSQVEKTDPDAPSPRELRRRRDAIWSAIQATPDFWLTLEPIEAGAVRRIHSLALHHGWEVIFMTQRPDTKGDSVQRQTQRWLVAQGFDLPSVLVTAGSRGAAAAALRLDYHVDDSAQNCFDIVANSTAKPLLVTADSDETTVAAARRLGIGTAGSIIECLEVLERATLTHNQPGVLRRIATRVGWK